MPRDLSAAATLDVNSDSLQEVWVFLIEITHPELDPPIRLVGNTETIISNEETYLPVGLSIPIPDELPDELSTKTVVVSDIDLSIIAALRQIPVERERPQLSLRVVLASSPDVIEGGPFNLEIQKHKRDSNTITLTVSTENIVRREFPGKDILPNAFPNLF
jgi:hypothetical protein